MKNIQTTQLDRLIESGLAPQLGINLENSKEFRTFRASVVYETAEDLVESEEFKEAWSGFQGMERDARRIKETNFITAFKVDTDPKTNYGRKFRLFYVIRNSDDFRSMQEVTISKMLSNSPMREVYLFEDSFVFGDKYYSKSCRKTRQHLANLDRCVTSIS